MAGSGGLWSGQRPSVPDDLHVKLIPVFENRWKMSVRCCEALRTYL